MPLRWRRGVPLLRQLPFAHIRSPAVPLLERFEHVRVHACGVLPCAGRQSFPRDYGQRPVEDYGRARLRLVILLLLHAKQGAPASLLPVPRALQLRVLRRAESRPRDQHRELQVRRFAHVPAHFRGQCARVQVVLRRVSGSLRHALFPRERHERRCEREPPPVRSSLDARPLHEAP